MLHNTLSFKLFQEIDTKEREKPPYTAQRTDIFGGDTIETIKDDKYPWLDTHHE